MRYIDADALQKRLTDCEFETNCVSEENKREILKILRIFIPQIIANEPTADVESVKHWISVKERLPENDYLYIVCKTVRGHQISFEARWEGGKWLSVTKNLQLEYVTHWMPLPEPPGCGLT